MDKIIHSKNLLCSVKVYKVVENSEVVANVVANLLVNVLAGVGGRIVNDFTLRLTDKHLYIDANGYSTWGGLPETNNEYTIAIKDIDAFNIKVENSETIIEIKTSLIKKQLIFICKNEKCRLYF